MVTPLIGIVSAEQPIMDDVYEPNFDSGVGVQPGHTIYYDIDAFDLPAEMLGNLTQPDMVGNQLYIKVMSVENDFEYNSTLTGTFIRFGVGMIFTKNTAITYGEGLTAISAVIPAGSATPAAGVGAAPFFFDGPPCFFALNSNWSLHTMTLQYLGFTVTQDTNTFNASLTGITGTMDGTWRKSDGLLTSFEIDNLNWTEFDATGIHVAISLNKVELRELPVEVSDEIEMKLTVADMTHSGTGEDYTSYMKDELDNIAGNMSLYEGLVMGKAVIAETEGLYYTANMYVYNETTTNLEHQIDVVFNAFMPTIQIVEPPLYDPIIFITGFKDMFTQAVDMYYNEYAVSPAITPDWDIYQGVMKLGAYLVDFGLDTMMDISPPPEDEVTIHTANINVGFETNGQYKYFRQSASVDIEENATWAYTIPIKNPNAVYTHYTRTKVTEQIWMAYHETGVFAGLGMKMSMTQSGRISGVTESFTVNVNMRMLNPDYNPPDPLATGGFIPGFTWLVAIPAVMATAATVAVVRKRRK
jgi:hypothetical protein